MRMMSVLEEAEQQGTPRRIAEETLLAMSISIFVESLGREAAARLVERLPDRIKQGDFGG